MPDQHVRLPWGAWGSDTELELPLPAGWVAEHLAMAGRAALTLEEIAGAFDRPVASASLEELASKASTAVVAVDDLTRPTRAEALVLEVLRRLERGGLGSDAVTVLVASGAHAPLTADQCRHKLGAVVDRVRVQSHSQDGPFADTGTQLGGAEVRLNESFMAADLRIGIGAVLPHPFAGFSGGGKVVVPGLAGLDVLARTHKMALMGLGGGPDLDTNRFRKAMEAAVRDIGLHFTVNVVVNQARDTCGVFCGDMVGAHRSAAEFARNVGATRLPDEPCDALVLNAYPKDNELLQVEAALVAIQQGLLAGLAPGAPVVLAASCEFGLGYHGLFGPGGRLFRRPVRKGSLGERPMAVFAPGCSAEECALAFWEGYTHCRAWEAALDWLRPRVPPAATIRVLPTAPLQVAALAVDVANSESHTVEAHRS